MALFTFPVFASGESGVVYLRAKIDYRYDDESVAVDDSAIKLNSGWTKTDGWFYYHEPVKSGDVIKLMEGVQIPASWTSEQAGKQFDIVINAEISEVMSDGSVQNTAPIYSESNKYYNTTYISEKDNKNINVEKGSLKVKIKEYQIDNGKKTDYQNKKIVLPGQYVDKIVEIEITGKPTSLIQKITEQKPEVKPEPKNPKPVKQEETVIQEKKESETKIITEKTSIVEKTIEQVHVMTQNITTYVEQKVHAYSTGDDSNIPFYAGIIAFTVGMAIYKKRKGGKS